MENMIHWGIKMTMYLLQRSDKKLICPFYFLDRAWIPIFLLCLQCGRVAMCTLQPLGWRGSGGHTANFCLAAKRNSSNCWHSAELEQKLQNTNYKQITLAKMSRHSNINPELKSSY